MHFIPLMFIILLYFIIIIDCYYPVYPTAYLVEADYIHVSACGYEGGKSAPAYIECLSQTLDDLKSLLEGNVFTPYQK